VELLTHSRLQLAHGRNLDIITQAQTIESFLPLKNDLSLMSCGLYLSELIDAFTAEDIEAVDIFTLFCDMLHQLTLSYNKDTLLRYFELKLLDMTGYRPQLQRCASCNVLLEPVANFFCASQGGVVCPECALTEPSAARLSLNALKVLRLWQNCSYDMACRVNINAALSLELEQVLREYIKYILDRQIKSTEW
jgi:DNA repair protein RecO (recombination protein O)